MRYNETAALELAGSWAVLSLALWSGEVRHRGRSARDGEAFRKRVGRRQRIVPQEPDDGRHVADGRNGCWNLKWRHRAAAVVAFTPELNDTSLECAVPDSCVAWTTCTRSLTKLLLLAWL